MFLWPSWPLFTPASLAFSRKVSSVAAVAAPSAAALVRARANSPTPRRRDMAQDRRSPGSFDLPRSSKSPYLTKECCLPHLVIFEMSPGTINPYFRALAGSGYVDCARTVWQLGNAAFDLVCYGESSGRGLQQEACLLRGSDVPGTVNSSTLGS